MKTPLLPLTATLAVLGVSLAHAEDTAKSPFALSFTLGATSDYVFRGVSQTQNEPAVQGGLELAHDSGFYVGLWGSNVDWVEAGGYKEDNSLEVDLYGGFRGTFADSFGYDFGIITYYYPGDKISGAVDPDTTEVYAGLSWKTVALNTTTRFPTTSSAGPPTMAAIPAAATTSISRPAMTWAGAGVCSATSGIRKWKTTTQPRTPTGNSA